MKKHLKYLICAAVLVSLLTAPAHALIYNIDAPEDYLFGRPTSDDTIYETEPVNVDRSKNVAKIAPAFGSPTSYLPNSGEYLTPNLVPGALSGGLVNSLGSVNNPVSIDSSGYPAVSTSVSAGSYPTSPAVSTGNSGFSYEITGYTNVTDDLYYAGGWLGTLEIPAINLDAKIYQGTGDASLAKGIGHFEDTSIWGGNVCLAAHNRGVNNIFGQIHTLESGDKITLTTKLGSRTYTVASVEQISYTDGSMLKSTTENCITLFTCVRDQSAYRWCVRAVAE